jgi:rhodanese-related sulfurtransferase
MKTRIKLLPALVLMMLMLSGHGAAWPTPGFAADPPGRRPEPSSRTLATPATAAMFGLREKKITLIDVRPPSAFDQYHIAGSLNIPLHAIKTKTYLKTKPIVLVNEGYVVNPLAAACESLNTVGFKASVMAGGLVAWKAIGGRLVGDPFAQSAMNRISPQLLLQEMNNTHDVMIDASQINDPRTKKWIPDAEPLPFQTIQKENGPAKLERLLKDQSASDPFARLVIFTTTGVENDRIQRRLAQAGIRQVFFLEGGLRAFEKYLQDIQLARRPKHERKASTGGCPSCVQTN